MNKLVTYLNLNTTSGNASATLCNGTFAWPATASVDDVKNVNIKSLTLSCCGNPGSCIIDGGAPGVNRNISLFNYYKRLIGLDIQGIKFQNIKCSKKDSDCWGGLLYAQYSRITFKHNTVRNVISYYVSTLLSELISAYLTKLLPFHSPYGLNPQLGAVSLVGRRNDSFPVVIENCTFSDNNSDDGFGGGLFVGQLPNASVTLNGNLFLRNTAFSGGAFFTYDSEVVANCNSYTNNTATYGGAIAAESYLTSTGLTINADIFTGNTAAEVSLL